MHLSSEGIPVDDRRRRLSTLFHAQSCFTARWGKSLSEILCSFAIRLFGLHFFRTLYPLFLFVSVSCTYKLSCGILSWQRISFCQHILACCYHIAPEWCLAAPRTLYLDTVPPTDVVWNDVATGELTTQDGDKFRTGAGVVADVRATPHRLTPVLPRHTT